MRPCLSAHPPARFGRSARSGPSSTPARQQGFTFIELMTSVIVAAVLLAVAVPGLAQFIRNSRVSSAQSELVSSMMLARSEASKRGQEVRITGAAGRSTADFGNGWVVWTDVNGNDAVDSAAGDQEVIRTYPSPSSGVFVSTLTGAEDLRFAPTGFLSRTAEVKFKVCDARDGGRGFVVTVQPVGLTDIQEFANISPRPTCP